MSTQIAIVGLGCRMPGAASPAAYWQNLVAGVESLRDFSDAELLAAGVAPEDIAAPGYVKRAPVLDDIAGFDAGLFGYTPGDAAIADPQQRIFLEVCRDALDDSGLTLIARRLTTGVFASSGGSVSSYLVSVVRALDDTRTLSTGAAIHLGNDKDFLSTRASYKLDLSGPSLNVQTACSSSIVALHLACQSLLSGECDIALAGASCVRVPQVAGYHPGADPVLSNDGRCRPFDAQASGTLFGSGAGAVVLRRLADAERDGDSIRAVILATGINNDGGQKVSYTAASVPGQRACIESVLRRAEVSADELRYVECHGTATKIGDPLELKGLTQAFRKTTARKRYCGIGSVKGNIGHLEQAAGLASLIKTVLMLEHKKLVPSLHCDTVNPKLNLDDSPFYVTRRAEDWADAGPRGRTAGLSCLGMGGTNAFAVLREHTSGAAARRSPPSAPSGTLFCLSAKTGDALLAYARRYAGFLREGAHGASLAEIAYTTNISRTELEHRLALVVESTDELASRLERLASTGEGERTGRRLPMAYLCEVDTGYDARQLAAATLESAPDDFRQRHRELAGKVAAALAQCEPEVGTAGLSVPRQVAAVFECELLLHELSLYHGVRFDSYQGDGLGGHIVQCLRDATLLESCLSHALRSAVEWTHRAGSGTYQAFTQHFRQELERARGSHGAERAPAAPDERTHCFVRTHDDGSQPARAITLAEHAKGLAPWLGALYAAGVHVRWERVYQEPTPAKVSLPTYPYQRKPHWFTDILKETKHGRRVSGAGHHHP
jgi:acyl transferase domain-containing protein